MYTVDFMETYSPTPEVLCGKTVVDVAVERDWELRQLDIKQAFIQADLDNDGHVKLPDGSGDKSGEIVKLNQAVYGLKQAGRQCFVAFRAQGICEMVSDGAGGLSLVM